MSHAAHLFRRENSGRLMNCNDAHGCYHVTKFKNNISLTFTYRGIKYYTLHKKIILEIHVKLNISLQLNQCLRVTVVLQVNQ